MLNFFGKPTKKQTKRPRYTIQSSLYHNTQIIASLPYDCGRKRVLNLHREYVVVDNKDQTTGGSALLVSLPKSQNKVWIEHKGSEIVVGEYEFTVEHDGMLPVWWVFPDYINGGRLADMVFVLESSSDESYRVFNLAEKRIHTVKKQDIRELL